MSRRSPIAWLSGAALLGGLVVVPAAPAGAATSSQGTVTVTASGAAGKALRRADVRLQAPRTAALVDGSTRLTFTVASRTVRGPEATLPLRGDLRFTRRGRTVRYASLRATVRSGAVRITGRVSGRGPRTTVLAGRPRAKALTLDRARRAVAVRATTTSLSAAAARRLRAELRLSRTPAGTLGAVTVAAGLQPVGGTTGGGTTTGTGTGGGTTTGTPTVQPATTEPPALARTANAADVVGATVVWRVRESFIRYVNTGEGTTVRDGATADPAENLPDAGVPLVYQFRFPFRAGWGDPTNGAAAVTFSGGVRFRYVQHTIDFTTADPEIELNGDNSRAIFRLTGADGTAFTGRRTVLLDLKPSAAASRTVSPDGKTVTYERIPASVPAGTGDSVFAGFYLAGQPFGWVSITYTLA
ncbi:MAG: HtaA domain-containing protein [Solirubrobacteraceae bacterium]|nr:HtaA domain-containing protein [Solirubrobacteraceae bacterium]